MILSAKWWQAAILLSLLIGLTLAGGWAASQGAHVNIDVQLQMQARLDYLETQINIPVNSTISAMVKTASYIISTHGSYVCLINGSDDRAGRLEYYSTNATLIANAVYGNMTQGGTVVWRSGTYTFDGFLIPIVYSGIHTVSEGWSTIFNITATGGFNISASSMLNDISFENIYWIDAGGSGTAVANYGITSAMPATMRLSHFKFTGNRVDYFRKAGTIFLNLTNAEVNTISNNFFYHTTTAFIQFISNFYQCGNNKLYDNVFYGGYDANYENAIRITKNAGNSTENSSVGEIYSWGNQWYGQHYDYGGTFYAWNMTELGIYGATGGIYSSGDRYENTAVLSSNGYSSAHLCIGGIFSDNRIENMNATVVFDLGNNTKLTEVCNNQIDVVAGTTFYSENYTTDYRPNSVHDNIFASHSASVYINATSYTRVYNNINYNPIGYIANWKALGSRVSPYQGYASTFTNGTTYRVSTTPCHFNVTGGTGINITVSDYDGNAFINGATSLYWFYMPIDFKITCVYATSPTAVVIFD